MAKRRYNQEKRKGVWAMEQQKKTIPSVESRLRHNILEMPKEIRKASGIVIYGRRIKSLVFTTDLAIIKNCDADAVFAVYPVTPQQSISDAMIKASYIPIFPSLPSAATVPRPSQPPSKRGPMPLPIPRLRLRSCSKP